MPATDPREVSHIYLDTRDRIVALMADRDERGWDTAVPACPGWSVRDVVAHMTAVAQDWADGTFTAPPNDEQTAAQVARFQGHDVADIVMAWTTASARLNRLAETSGLEPPLGDIACHEHDIRGAVGRPGARDSAAVEWTSDRLLTLLEPPLPMRVVVEDADYRSGRHDGAEICLRTTRFEALRWRTGRRSRAQLVAMDWSDDPSPLLDHLCLFGPALADLVE